MSIILNVKILEHNKCDYQFIHLPQTAINSYMSNSLFTCNLRYVNIFNQKKPNF